MVKEQGEQEVFLISCLCAAFKKIIEDRRSYLPFYAAINGGVAQVVRAHGSYPWRHWFESSHRYHSRKW